MMRYAAYGSNLHPLRLGERTPTARCLGTSRLDGWSLHFHKRGLDASAKCNILPGGAGVHVAVYEMASGCKQTLDAIEGVGRGYRCEKINIPGFGLCFIYLAENAHIDLSLLPYDWYGELVVLDRNGGQVVSLGIAADEAEKVSRLRESTEEEGRHGGPISEADGDGGESNGPAGGEREEAEPQGQRPDERGVRPGDPHADDRDHHDRRRRRIHRPCA